MKHILKNLKQFHHILILITIFFSLILFLSIPALFNYESFKNEIKKNISKDFKISLSNLNNINYSFLPGPHLKIEDVNLKINENSKTSIAKIKEVKLFISLFDLYNGKKINVEKIEIENSNFNFHFNDLREFNKHLNFVINKKIIIKNSNFFYKDKNDDVVSISPIKNFKYNINFKQREKNLNIRGKLFDIDYNFIWSKNFNEPHINTTNINFKNPTVRINNKIKKNYTNKKINGDFKIKFLNNENNIIYEYENNKFIFSSPNPIKNNLDLNGKINFKPFYFNINATLKEVDFDFIINQLLLKIYNNKETINSKFNGNLNFNFKNLNHNFIQNGYSNIVFKDSLLNIKKINFDLNKIGNLNINKYDFYEDNGTQFFSSDIVLNINNTKEFYKIFSIPKKKRVKIKKIFFKLNKNLETNKYYISNISLDDANNDLIKKENDDKSSPFEFNNIQQLRKIIQKKFDKI